MFLSSDKRSLLPGLSANRCTECPDQVWYPLCRGSVTRISEFETSCAASAPLPMESRLPEDTVGELPRNAERSDGKSRRGPIMNFDQINRTPMESRAERWRVRRGPIYRARGGGVVWPMPSIDLVHSNPLACPYEFVNVYYRARR